MLLNRRIDRCPEKLTQRVFDGLKKSMKKSRIKIPKEWEFTIYSVDS